MVKVNWDQAKGFEALPAGKYPARFTGYTTKPAGPNAKYPGSEVLVAEFTLTGEGVAGRKMFRNFSIEHAVWAFKQFCVRLGIPAEELTGSGDTSILNQYIGTDVVLEVDLSEFNGEERNNVRAIHEADNAFEVVSRKRR